ncbi:MAG: uroporphyrinogen-III synthase, partial [Pseudohongiellaceae bacterium]
MPDKPVIDSPLLNQTVALPESRQLDVLADLFERRGAQVLRVPLVAILDSPNRVAVEAWLSDFILDTPDFLVILTGEGLRRLCGFAERSIGLAGFVSALEKTVKICRGPKPGRALKEIGLQPDLLGKAPTTAGIIA